MRQSPKGFRRDISRVTEQRGVIVQLSWNDAILRLLRGKQASLSYGLQKASGTRRTLEVPYRHAERSVTLPNLCNNVNR